MTFGLHFKQQPVTQVGFSVRYKVVVWLPKRMKRVGVGGCAKMAPKVKF